MIKIEKIEHRYCDLCGIEDEKVKTISYPVMFLTEQDEGKPTTPYYELTHLELCPECIKKTIKIKAYGAQGNNSYSYIE